MRSQNVGVAVLRFAKYNSDFMVIENNANEQNSRARKAKVCQTQFRAPTSTTASLTVLHVTTKYCIVDTCRGLQNLKSYIIRGHRSIVHVEQRLRAQQRYRVGFANFVMPWIKMRLWVWGRNGRKPSWNIWWNSNWDVRCVRWGWIRVACDGGVAHCARGNALVTFTQCRTRRSSNFRRALPPPRWRWSWKPM